MDNYKEAQKHQLAEWIAGRPWHNPFDPCTNKRNDEDKTHGECCPDFSCCQPDMLWPEHLRLKFADANDELRMQLMMGALGNLCGDEVYIAGDEPGSIN